jgi:serine/threonine-protein kinase RsbW
MPQQQPDGRALHLDLIVPSDTLEARRVLERLENELRSCEVPDRDTFSIVMAIEEALINAIKHGNQLDPAKKVHVTFRIEGPWCTVEIRDEGPGFDPEDVPDPTEVENLERPCGRGLLMMRHYMHVVEYKSGGSVVFMQREFGSS